MLGFFIITNTKKKFQRDANIFLNIFKYDIAFDNNLTELYAKRFGIKYNELRFLIDCKKHAKGYSEQSFEDEGGFA